MNKDEAVSFLKKKGYQAENSRGVVTILYDRPQMVSEYKQILLLLREHGYQGSFGMKAVISTGNASEEFLTNTVSKKEQDAILEEVQEEAEDLEDFYADEEDEEVDASQLSFFENGNGQLSFL